MSRLRMRSTSSRGIFASAAFHAAEPGIASVGRQLERIQHGSIRRFGRIAHCRCARPRRRRRAPRSARPFRRARSTRRRCRIAGRDLRPAPWFGGGSSMPKYLENARRSSSVISWLRNTRTSCRYQAPLMASTWASLTDARSTPRISAPTVPVGMISTSNATDIPLLLERLRLEDCSPPGDHSSAGRSSVQSAVRPPRVHNPDSARFPPGRKPMLTRRELLIGAIAAGATMHLRTGFAKASQRRRR